MNLPSPFFPKFLETPFSTMFFLDYFWGSMTTPRSGPRPSTSQANLSCVICDQFSKGGIRQKFSPQERPKAVNLRGAAEYLMHEVYTHIAELLTPEPILAADLQIHPTCFPEYMHKWNEAKQKKNTQSKVSDSYFI